jgi:hypothetical protein
MRAVATGLVLLAVFSTAEVGAQAEWPFGERLLAPRSGAQKAPLIVRGAAAPLATVDTEAPPMVVVTRPALPATEATDCAMVKPVNPQFHSMMPVVSPDSKVEYALRIIPVPACRPQTETRHPSSR